MLRKLAKRVGMARWAQAWRRFRWRVSGALRSQVTVETRQGKLTVSTADQIIGKSLFVHGGFEDAYVAATLSFLRAEGMLPPKGTGTVVDIGANLGVISIGMMRDAEFARAIAIEPDPYNFSLLQRNTRQNGLTPASFVCLQRAVSDRAGEVPFELSKDNFGDHRVRLENDEPVQASTAGDRYSESGRKVVRVPAETLDQLISEVPTEFRDQIALIWIDTQGHEGQVFAGGTRTFARDIPVVAEIWPYGIRRAGMSCRKFIDSMSAVWSRYWVWNPEKGFSAHPIAHMDALFDELGDDGNFDNVVLAQ